MRRLPGIISVKASYRQGNAVVEYDPAQVTPPEMVEAITSATYYQVGEPVVGTPFAQEQETGGPEGNSTAVIFVEGMADDRAASQVLAAMGRPEAIAAASVDLAAGTVTVKYDSSKVSAETLVSAIDQGTPYRASLVSKTEEDTGAPGEGTDYAPYVLIGITALFAAGLGWYGFSWGRRRLARAAPSRATRRRERRRR